MQLHPLLLYSSSSLIFFGYVCSDGQVIGQWSKLSADQLSQSESISEATVSSYRVTAAGAQGGCCHLYPLPSLVPLPSSHTMTSDPRHVAMESYWREVRSIEEEREEEEEAEERKSMDEVELEEAWLTEAGLSSLVTGLSSEEASPPAEALLSTLTRQQVAMVRRRLDNYNETLKKRNRPIRDVRDIFNTVVTNNDSADRCLTPVINPNPNHAVSPPSHYHTTTKTIRRNSATARPSLYKILPEHTYTHSATHTPSPPHTPSHPISQGRRADWLLRECPYSEGVAEHKLGGTCWDCLSFYGEDSSDEPFLPGCASQDLTCTDDLSSDDLMRLSFISHIELSTFLLALGIQIKQTRQPYHRTQDGNVFGVPLNTLLENDRKKFPEVKVPVVFQKLLSILEQSGLETEGILRVSGSAARLKHLRRELDRCSGSPEFDWSAVRQVDAAGLLKLFIRELPIPLLTHTHLSTYQAVLGVSSLVHQVQALQLLSLLLPESHRDTLRALLVFLRRVVSHQDQNRMSLWNVSMVMAPNLFTCCHPVSHHSVAKQQEEMEEALGGAHLVRLMVTHQDLLWMVPTFLLSQVRQMNQASNPKLSSFTKMTRHLLMKKNDKYDRNQVTELWEGVIRVHAPLHTKVSMAIQLDRQTRAKDVTSRFKCEKPSKIQHLYEVGGNICERRLHPDCILLDVYRVNPHCDWLIKP